MSEDDAERQENELLALQSIFDRRLFCRSTDKQGGSISVYLTMPNDLVVRYSTAKSNPADCSIEEESRLESRVYHELKIDHFPPVTMDFELPKDYPTSSPPAFTLSCKWLNVFQLSRLCRELDRLWRERGHGEEILFLWTQFLTDETISTLQIKSPFLLTVVPQKNHLNVLLSSDPAPRSQIDHRAYQDVASVSALIPFLTDYNKSEKQRIFESSYFDCQVCFCEKRGVDCVQFPKCNHVYCVDCMKGYFSVQIQDGAVRALNCPAEKCESIADPGLVKRLVSREVFLKYDRFLLQSTLDCMMDMTFCPRPTCQTPVLKESDQSLARCANCEFTFCFLCKRTYHGVSPCPVDAKELVKLREQYLNASPGEKLALEKRYGKARLEHAVAEHFTDVWLEANSQKCPGCQRPIQKIDGCNKMTCFKCLCYFCWLCLKRLPTSNPYEHFSDLRQTCYNRLFDGVQDAEVRFEEDMLLDEIPLLEEVAVQNAL